MPRNSDWTTPPGGTRAPRNIAKTLLTSLIVGVLSVGMAWAGAGLVPVSVDKATDSAQGRGVENFQGAEESGDGGAPAAAAYSPADLQPGQILAGAAKVSLFPRPEDYQEQFPGARWEQDQTKCEFTDPSGNGIKEGATHVADFRVRWPENPDCLYMGGYGIGPVNSITSWDEEFGLWSRSVAMQDSNGDALVMTLIDAVYWEAFYNSLCPGDPCGFLPLAEQLAEETGLKPENFVFFSTHSHTAPDFIGGWGAVPDWYMQQATDSLKASAKAALAQMEPAVLEAGEAIVRQHNSERRRHYRSAEDDGMSWFRLIDADNQPRPEVCTTPAPTPAPTEGNNGNGEGNGFGNQGKETPAPAPEPTCEPAAEGRAIATVAAYAGHPVTEDESGGQGDADFPAVFAREVERDFGGVGMFLQTGLGNMSPRGAGIGDSPKACSDGIDNDEDGKVDSAEDEGCTGDTPEKRAADSSELADKEQIGIGLAAILPGVGGGTQITDTDLRVGRTTWDHPVTNIPLGSLGVAGFFDRTFNETPAAVNIGKSSYQHKKCSSASAISVETSVSAAKIGNLWITGGPGELFANLTNSIEEHNTRGITLALGLANDGLGYIVQSFETDHVARQGVGFANGPLSEYEDAYSIDHCFGDATLEHTRNLLDSLK